MDKANRVEINAPILVMHKNPRQPEVQGREIVAVLNMAINAKYKHSIVRADRMNVILGAKKTHFEMEAVQEHGCGALSNLTKNNKANHRSSPWRSPSIRSSRRCRTKSTFCDAGERVGGGLAIMQNHEYLLWCRRTHTGPSMCSPTGQDLHLADERRHGHYVSHALPHAER